MRDIVYVVKYHMLPPHSNGIIEPKSKKFYTYDDATKYAREVVETKYRDGYVASNVEIDKITTEKTSKLETVPVEEWNPLFQDLGERLYDKDGTTSYQVTFILEPKEKNLPVPGGDFKPIHDGKHELEYRTKEAAFELAKSLVNRKGSWYADRMAPHYWFRNPCVYETRGNRRRYIPVTEWLHYESNSDSDKRKPPRIAEIKHTRIPSEWECNWDKSIQMEELKANNEFITTELRKAMEEIKKLNGEA